MSVEEERKLRREVIDAEASVESGLNVSNAVGKAESDFLDGSRACFTDVIAGNRNGIPLGKRVAAPRENISDDAHCRAHGIDVRPARDVFLEDVILDGAGKLGEVRALFFCDAT